MARPVPNTWTQRVTTYCTMKQVHILGKLKRCAGANMITSVLLLLPLLCIVAATKYECDGNTCCDYECYGAHWTLSQAAVIVCCWSRLAGLQYMTEIRLCVTVQAMNTSVAKIPLHGDHARSGAGGLAQQQASQRVRKRSLVTTTQASSAQRPSNLIRTAAWILHMHVAMVSPVSLKP